MTRRSTAPVAPLLPSYTRVYSLSDDGKHMIETVVGQGKDGKPFTRVNTWNRQ